MRRREFIAGLGGVALPLGAAAQQPSKIARVGFFRQRSRLRSISMHSEAAWARSDMLKARTSPSNSVTRLALTTNSASLPRI